MSASGARKKLKPTQQKIKRKTVDYLLLGVEYRIRRERVNERMNMNARDAACYVYWQRSRSTIT